MEEVTIDHVAKSIAFDMRSAPWGLVEGKDDNARVRARKEDLAAQKEAKQLSGEDSSTTYDRDGSDGLDGYHDSYEVDYPKTPPKYPEYIRRTNFTYNIHSPSNVQTFPVMAEDTRLGIDFGIVVLRLLNVEQMGGGDDFTGSVCMDNGLARFQPQMCMGSHR